MFTGIAEEIGVVENIRASADYLVITIKAERVLEGTVTGDSIAVNGVCLTVTAVSERTFSADATPETMARTALGKLSHGSPVNLERAMAADGRFGGHIVMGHIDGKGRVTESRRQGNSIIFSVTAPESIMRYIVMKGSVAVDGISLTVADISERGFSVSVIPHTASVTTIGLMRPGSEVNIETDIIGKYVEKFVSPAKKGITKEMLSAYGF